MTENLELRSAIRSEHETLKQLLQAAKERRYEGSVRYWEKRTLLLTRIRGKSERPHGNIDVMVCLGSPDQGGVLTWGAERSITWTIFAG